MAEVKERHSRNVPALSAEDMERIYRSRVLVVGCGGLGGNNIEYLTRAGIGFLRVVDGDAFAPSNLNRQILSTSAGLGMPKAIAAADRIKAIDPDVEAEAVCEYLTKENAASLMAGVDLVIDALDNIDSRLILEDAAAEAGLTIVHGAIRGWDLQVMIVPPGSGLLHELYVAPPEKSVSPSLPVTPAACAAMQSAVALRLLTGKDTLGERTLLVGSLSDMSFETIHFSED